MLGGRSMYASTSSSASMKPANLGAGPELIGHPPPLGLGGLGAARELAIKAETTRRVLFPASASALRMVWTRQRCEVAFIRCATPP